MIGGGDLGGGRWRGGADIGSEIGQGEIGFVPHTADDRDRRSGYRSRDSFIVERPQIFYRAATARDDDHIGFKFIGVINRFDDLRWRINALHLSRADDHFE